MVDSGEPQQQPKAVNGGVAVVVFDLDNTLIFTDEANNYSYIETLKHFGYSASRLQSITRITSKDIQKSYPEIPRFKLWRIRQKKLKLFLDNLHMVRLNQLVVKAIDRYSNPRIVIWTASNRRRAKTEVEYFNLSADWILFSKKDTTAAVKSIVSKLKKRYHINQSQIVFYDDSVTTLGLLREIGASVVLV
jgi:phosphoglycolate phosphatase-like HAD superfamily hydrolase